VLKIYSIIMMSDNLDVNDKLVNVKVSTSPLSRTDYAHAYWGG